MTVNGVFYEYEEINLLEFLRENGYTPAHVVVEKNREIITKERFPNVILQKNDEINILHFMGGG